MSVGVVGGGIVGLAVARELLLQRPHEPVTVFEKEPAVAMHQSGHNSGVLHAGVYYPPGSLKAELCREGGALMRELCQQHAIPLRELGKLIVARSESELPALAMIEDRATRNQVPGVRRISQTQITEIEPYVQGVAALHSPHTAALDYRAVCAALVQEIAHAEGQVLLETPVTGIRETGSGVQVSSAQSEWTFDRLVVCAGLRGDSLAAQVRAEDDVRILPFRGEYYELRASARHQVNGMVYPVPDPRYPFLGVHLTRGVDDRVHVGPNAVLALSLEGYRWRDVDTRDLAGLLGWPGTRALARANWRNGLSEVAGSLSRRRYLARARDYLPALQLADLAPSTAGVRAQAVRRDGSLVDDFVLEPAGRTLLVRNAPSPAATSSLAIARRIVVALFG